MTVPHLNPPLLERLGLGPGRQQLWAREVRTDRALMARSMMYLFAAGATVSLVLVLVLPAGIDQGRIFVTSACGYALAGALLIGYDRLPKWAFVVFLAVETALIEWTIYAGGASTSAFAMLYVWIAIYAFYFFSVVQAAAQLVFVALSYGAVLSLTPDVSSYPVVRWAVTTSVLIGAGALIGLLKRRVDRLVGQLADASRSDPETGLLNRRALHEVLVRAIEQARRTRRPIAVVSCDIGALLDPIQRHGTPEEQRLMERIGEIVNASVRTIDAAARTGPHTLAVVLSLGDDHIAYVVGELLQQKLADAFGSDSSGVRVPFGVASFPLHADNADALLAAADQALREAEQDGEGEPADHSAVRQPPDTAALAGGARRSAA
ncbi:MAG TPA: GGDEF domain-containing protein [Solirubrobacteraceae bacterium]|nr:GGDEF domain-containing protein [Solirubrobacteraceae bacterium]